MTYVDAVALTDAAGIPVDQARGACLANVGTAGTLLLWTIGDPDTAEYRANIGVVLLMTQASTFTPPG